MARLVTVVAPGVAMDTKGWAVGLYVADALAVVTLFTLRRSRTRALVGLVAGLLA